MVLQKQFLGDALSWYQKKIASYDQPIWEKTIEERVSRGFSYAVPKKVARVKTELIDLDLIRGSYFDKTKPRKSWLTTTYLGILKVLLLPFYLKWWTDQTNYWISCILLILYSLQSISMYIYFTSEKDKDFEDVPISEVISPLFMFIILGTIQSQIAPSHLVNNSRTRARFDSLKLCKRSNDSSDCLKEKVTKLEKSQKGRFLVNSVEVTEKCSEESGLELGLNDSSGSHCSSKKIGKLSDRDNDIGESDISTNSSLEIKGKSSSVLYSDYQIDTDGETSADECSPYSTVDSNHKLDLDQMKNLMKKMKSSRYKENKKSDKIISGKFESKEKLKARLNKLSLNTQNENVYSSGESECSISPNSPINKLSSDSDWPVLNSDGSSEEGNENINNFEETEYSLFNSDDIPTLNFMGDNYHCTRSGKPSNDKVSCAIWQHRECQKVDLSVLDISSSIIRKVELVKHSSEYFLLGFICSILFSLIPFIFRTRLTLSMNHLKPSFSTLSHTQRSSSNTSTHLAHSEFSTGLMTDSNCSTNWALQFVIGVAIVERFFLSLSFFFLLCVAERTFRERFLYWKYFGHLTSPRRAKLSELPHFRLNKVRNIKTWLSVRSYLQKHGPQHSIDVIVSSSFIIEVSILTFLCIQLLRETDLCSEMLSCWEMVFWNLAIGLYIMRLMILGSKMNHKSRGSSAILLSEQINLYLQLEQKPHKKEKLTLANSVIKSAADLLKQLEAPFKISGLSANPYLYNVIKVIVLSAFSAALSELLGFKLKLFKIKISS